MITKEMEDLPPAKLSELVDSLSYIRLETSKDCMMGHASRYRLMNTPVGFVVYNANSRSEPLVFSHEGKFISKIGRFGKGPGEFLYPYSVRFDKKDQVFLIVNHRSVHYYSTEFEHLKTIKLDTETRAITTVVPLPDGRVAALYWEPTETPVTEIGVLIMDENGEVQIEYDLTDPKSMGSYRGMYLFNKLYLRGGKLIFSSGPDRNIFSLNKKGEWELECAVDYYFPRTPESILAKGFRSEELIEYQNTHPTDFYAVLNGDFLSLMYHVPIGIKLYINRKTGKVYHAAYDMVFHRWGLQNDLDGGRPVDIKSFKGDKSYELIDMNRIFWDIENLANNTKGVDPEMCAAYQSFISTLKESDNPIIRVSHLKND